MSRTLTAKLASIQPGTLFVGVDLAHKENVAETVDAVARRVKRFRFTHDRAGYDALERELQALEERYAAPEILIGMEPTNYYWKLVAAELERQGRRYCLVNAYTVKKHREGDQLDRSKDDPRDAFTIGELVRTGKYTETQLLRGEYAELRELCTLYARLQRDQRRQRQYIQHCLGQLFPELRTVFKDPLGLTARALLRHHAAATHLRELPFTTLVAAVRTDFGGQRLQISKLRQAHELAQHSIGLAEGVQGLQLALRLHLAQWEQLQAHLNEVYQAIEAVFLGLPEAPYLLSVPRLGLITAATILAEIGDPRRYQRGHQLIKLAGTQPVPDHSGQKTHSRTPMSHQGRPRLRTSVFFAVLRLIQADPAFAQAYQRLQQRNTHPLTPMEALGAMINKLLRILWALMRDQQPYDPTRFTAN